MRATVLASQASPPRSRRYHCRVSGRGGRRHSLPLRTAAQAGLPHTSPPVCPQPPSVTHTMAVGSEGGGAGHWSRTIAPTTMSVVTMHAVHARQPPPSGGVSAAAAAPEGGRRPAEACSRRSRDPAPAGGLVGGGSGGPIQRRHHHHVGHQRAPVLPHHAPSHTWASMDVVAAEVGIG
jgi:hypothetical protein